MPRFIIRICMDFIIMVYNVASSRSISRNLRVSLAIHAMFSMSQRNMHHLIEMDSMVRSYRTKYQRNEAINMFKLIKIYQFNTKKQLFFTYLTF
jgi:hypothetical protein